MANEITVEQSFKAFEQLLTTQQDVNKSIEAAGDNPVAQQVAKARGLVALRDAFSDAAMPAVMQLAGSAIGFRTDKDIDGGGTSYGALIVRDAVLAALMDGVELMHNQFNIIAGRYYVTTEGCDHKLASLPYLSDLDIQVGNPEDVDIQEAPSNNGNYKVFTVYGFVPVVITCRIYGEEFRQLNVKTEQLDGRFQVSASGKDRLKTVDSLKSKAEKRAKERMIQFAKTATAAGPVVAPVTRPAETESTPPKAAEREPQPPRFGIDELSSKQLAALFKKHDVTNAATKILNATTAEQRNEVLQFARTDKETTDDGFQVLVEYADSKK